MSDETAKPPTPRTRAEVFRALVHDSRIGSGAFRTWHVLYHHAHHETGECFPGYRTIQGATGCHTGSIVGWLKELESAGWIAFKPGHSKQHRRGYKHIYLLLDGQGQPFFKVQSVSETGNGVLPEPETLKCSGNRKRYRCRNRKRSVSETGNVTKQHSSKECVVNNSGVNLADADPSTNPPLGAPRTPASRGAGAAAGVKRHPAFVDGNFLDEE